MPAILVPYVAKLDTTPQVHTADQPALGHAQAGILTLSGLKALEMTDLDRLSITLPGHRKRFKVGIAQLNEVRVLFGRSRSVCACGVRPGQG